MRSEPQRSGMSQAGGILLLVGAILAAFGALMMLAMFGMMSMLSGAFQGDPEAAAVPGFMRWLYLALAPVTAAGAIVGFIAWGKHRAGDDRKAGILGIVAGLLPPVQIVVLIGAVLCMVSPEAQGAKQEWQAQAP